MTFESIPWSIPIAGIFLFFFVLIVVVGMWEKRLIQTFAIPDEGDEHRLTTYGRVMNKAAHDLQYVYRGVYHDARGKMYKSRFDFWTSPDDLIMACVSCGSIGGMRNACVNLYSQLEDGHYLQTTDMTGENDLSGLTDLQIWPTLSFPKLVERHGRRLRKLDSPGVPYSDTPLRDLLSMRVRRTERLVERGDAHFVDEEKNVWKLTFKGAVRYYFVVVWWQTMRRGLRKLGLG